jgi:hypothetical protein
LVEHIPEEDGVAGSSPALGTKTKNFAKLTLQNFLFLCREEIRRISRARKALRCLRKLVEFEETVKVYWSCKDRDSGPWKIDLGIIPKFNGFFRPLRRKIPLSVNGIFHLCMIKVNSYA